MSSSRLVMCGCHEAGWHLLESLIDAGLRFDHLVTITETQADREHVSGFRDLTPLARKHGIPVYMAERYSLKTDRDREFFERERFDVLVQGGWQRLFPESVLATLRIGAIGVHGSADFLPRGRGRSPMNWSLIEGRKRFIMHQFLIRPGVDDGDVFDTETFDINEFDTIRTLYYKNVIVNRMMLVRSLPRLLAGTAELRPQAGEASYYPKRRPEDGLIDWEKMDVWEIHNFVRAQTRPYPGAFGELNGTMRRIWQAQVFDTRITYPDAPYGAVVENFEEALVVNCRGGLLLVNDHEPAN